MGFKVGHHTHVSSRHLFLGLTRCTVDSLLGGGRPSLWSHWASNRLHTVTCRGRDIWSPLLSLFLRLSAIVTRRLVFVLYFIFAFVKALIVLTVLVLLRERSTAASYLFWEVVISQKGRLFVQDLTLPTRLSTAWLFVLLRGVLLGGLSFGLTLRLLCPLLVAHVLLLLQALSL